MDESTQDKMLQPPTKKAKVMSEPTADRTYVAISHTGPELGPLRLKKWLQLDTICVCRPDEDIKGDPMSGEAKAKRIKALELCHEQRE